MASTAASSSVATSSAAPFYLLEISLISARHLTPISKSMRTYALVWTKPSRKLSTRSDQHGHTNPTWNEKLTFRVDSQFLLSDNSALNVEIYTTSWFRESMVGTVKVLISDLLPPTTSEPPQPRTIRFVALQIRRPSGDPQGILNMGVALLDSSTGITPPGNDPPPTGDEKPTHLWRSLSVGSEAYDNYNPGSMVNGSELCSDIGPSASIVAADMAKTSQPPPEAAPAPAAVRRPNGYEEKGSSIVGEMTMEEALAKGYDVRPKRDRRRKQDYDDDESSMSDSSSVSDRRSRRNSDGGRLSCFGSSYGIEFRIVCGDPPKNPTGNKKTSSTTSSHSRRNSISSKPSTC